MKNEIDSLTYRFEMEIELYNITEAFVYAGEVYITSEYTLPMELVAEIEDELLWSDLDHNADDCPFTDVGCEK